MKKHILLIFFLVCGISTMAQNGLGFNQYILNSQLINPAYYNQRSPITVNLAGRYQWMDYPGA
ncbi:MAG: type IX secretion system membrane protein PorP/SprF, partial [Crocinitomicaceae bacterium]